MAVHIGTSGWSYAHWTNVLYPEGLPAERRLNYYARQFQTVELNASYYRWPSDFAFASWRRQLPEGFVFTVKAPGALTHARRLYGPGDLACAYESGAQPPWVKARGASGTTTSFGGLGSSKARLFPWALVMRAPHLRRVPQPDLAAGKHVHTSRGVRGRVLRDERRWPPLCHLYAGSYSDDDLGWWADRIREWQGTGRDVFVYFNNDGRRECGAECDDIERDGWDLKSGGETALISGVRWESRKTWTRQSTSIQPLAVIH